MKDFVSCFAAEKSVISFEPVNLHTNQNVRGTEGGS